MGGWVCDRLTAKGTWGRVRARRARGGSGVSRGRVVVTVIFAWPSDAPRGLCVRAVRCRESVALTAKARARLRKEKAKYDVDMF